MKRSAAVAGVVALFVVGVAVGALGAYVLLAHQRLRHGPGMGGPGHRHMSAELQRRLDLTADQQRQVEAILGDSHRETMAIWQEVRPRVMAVIERAQNRIALILTPRQREEFERYRQERAERMEHLKHLLGSR
jgi:Spy/CpxP family protein refolding chaperone